MLSSTLIEQIFQTIDGQWSSNLQFAGVGTDSRADLSNKLFIPIKGDQFDGHDFLVKAIDQGAIAALWNKDYPRPDSVEASFPLILVEDTLRGLQDLAHHYRKTIDPKVIGITGSNGKTTTKDLVYSVCRKAFRTHRTEGNYNNHIGLPLTILSMPLDTEVLILEMGMNHFGEIELLSKIAQPDVAIITNIGESHIENLGSREGIARAKLEIISHMKKDGLIIYDGDEPLLEISSSLETKSVGFDAENDLCITNYKVLSDRTEFYLNDESTVFNTTLLGKHQAKNAAYSLAVGRHLGITDDKIQSGLKDLAETGMRFERLNGENGVVLINDAYNASPTSMRVTIDVFTELEGYDEKILVLGDMLELGEQSLEYHKEVSKSIPSSIDYLYTFGEHAKAISQSTKINSKHFATKEELIAQLEGKQKKGTIILFKASRGMRFEQLIESLINE